MRTFLFIGLTILVGLYSCSKDEHTIILSGKFNEISPVSGRSQPEFIWDQILIKSETGSTFSDTFKYEIINDKIKLLPAWTENSQITEFDIEIIDNARFKIQNLYSSIPEAPQSYMIYEK
jgi:hypothetical protein